MAGTSMRLNDSTRASAVRLCGESGIVRLVACVSESLCRRCAMSTLSGMAPGDIDDQGKLGLSECLHFLAVFMLRIKDEVSGMGLWGLKP